MKTLALLFLSFAMSASAQLMSTVPSVQALGVGAPAVATPTPFVCDGNHVGELYINVDPAVVSGKLWLCMNISGTPTWIQFPTVTFYVNGVPTQTIKCTPMSTTSAATTGAFSFNYASLGLTTLLTYQVQSLSPGTGANQLNQAYVTGTPSATTFSGVVETGVTSIVSLAPTVVPQATPTTVTAFVCGT